MKKLILLLLLVLLGGCAGGLTAVPDSERNIKGSADLPGRSKDALYSATRNWVEKYFTAAEQPIVFTDPAEGVVVGAGQIAYPCSWMSCLTKGDLEVQFKLFVKVSDGRIETVYRNLQLVSPSSDGQSGMVGPVWSQRDMDLIRPELIELQQKLFNVLKSDH